MNNKRPAIFVLSLLGAANLALWAVALLVFHRFPLLLGTCSLAYTFGLRHALDADHISAIDNVTRKMIQDRRRPVLVGFFFSLGHSTIVILLSIVIAFSAARIQSKFPAMKQVGGLVGTSVSAFFLLIIAAVNLIVLRSIFLAFQRVKRGEPFVEQNVETALGQLGLLGRILRPVVRLVDNSWKMYFVGLLFGLGFDTATEVGLLGMSATSATQGLPIWSIMVFPLLFTAGMCLLDTFDGILMLGAYRWAYIHPVRKLYYNMTITALSIVIAVIVGGIEALGMMGDQLDLHGWFWERIGASSNHFGLVGAMIVCIFVAAWFASAICYRLFGYHKLELAAHTVVTTLPIQTAHHPIE